LHTQIARPRISLLACVVGALIGAGALAVPLSASRAAEAMTCNNGDCRGSSSCDPMVGNNCRFWQSEGKWNCTNSECNAT
jgi:hypothetical protein